MGNLRIRSPTSKMWFSEKYASNNFIETSELTGASRTEIQRNCVTMLLHFITQILQDYPSFAINHPYQRRMI